VFEGPVSLGGTDIAQNFGVQWATFQHKQNAASFNGIKVGRDAVFDGAVGLTQPMCIPIWKRFLRHGYRADADKAFIATYQT
jgi:hypothetical protein